MTTKFLSAAAVAIISSFSAFAQQDTATKKSNIHIGFIYPISSNGTMAKEYTNAVSIHAIAGISKAEESFCGAGVANVVLEDARGFMGAGVLNFVHDSVEGVQAAGALNFVNNHIEGAQVAGFINMAGSVEGAQVAGFGNIAEKAVNGAQVAGFMNIAEGTEAQVAGFMNVGGGTEAQAAGFLNLADSAEAQIAGFMNGAGKNKGAQIAGFVNVSEEANTQIAGFVNIAHKVKGAQIAGFINIADSSDYSIGIVNIIGNGEKQVGVTMDNNLTTLVTLRSGGRILYGIIGGGYNLKTDDLLGALEAGIGAHIPVSKKFRINLEATCTSLTDFSTRAHFQSGMRILPAFKFAERFEIFAGPTLNMTMFDDSKDDGLVSSFLWSKYENGNFYGLHIGGVAGVQFSF